MKRKIIIIICILLFIVIMTTFVVQKLTYNNSYNIAINRVNNLLMEIKKYTQKFNYNLEGNINVTAKYKGAHGESYPANFQYIYLIDEQNETLTLENNGIYFEKKLNMDFINNLSKVDYDNLDSLISVNKKSTQNNKIYVSINEKKINEILGTAFKDANIIIETSGIILKKVDVIKINLDDMKIYYKDGKILINKDNNKIKIDLNSSGFSFNVNDKLKMNVFINNDKDQYNIVINEKVFYIECFKDKILFSTSSEAVIYNGLDLEITFNNIELKRREVIEENDIPIFRYFNEMKFDIGVK